MISAEKKDKVITHLKVRGLEEKQMIMNAFIRDFKNLFQRIDIPVYALEDKLYDNNRYSYITVGKIIKGISTDDEHHYIDVLIYGEFADKINNITTINFDMYYDGTYPDTIEKFIIEL